MTHQHYDIHVFYSRTNGFSVPVKIVSDEIQSDEEVIKFAVDNNFIDLEDSRSVDMVSWITEDEYKEMGGK